MAAARRGRRGASASALEVSGHGQERQDGQEEERDEDAVGEAEGEDVGDGGLEGFRQGERAQGLGVWVSE